MLPDAEFDHGQIEPWQVGATFQRASRERLPMWLSAGLELYWLGEHGIDIYETYGVATDINIPLWQTSAVADGLPGFGDAWFFPGLVGDGPCEDILSIAYAFVRYLIETGDMENLIAMHRGAFTEAEDIRAASWLSFTGIPSANDWGLVHYFGGRIRNVEGSPQSPFVLKFSAMGQYSRYSFGHRAAYPQEYWDWNMVEYYIAIGEESIRFIWDWLEAENSRRFNTFFIGIDETWGGGGYGGGMLTNFGSVNEPPWFMAHESAHAVISTARITSNFPRTPEGHFLSQFKHFEEGLCTVIELLFEAETVNQRFAREAAAQRIDRMENWFGVTIGDDHGRLTRECIEIYLNNRALSEIEHRGFENASMFGRQYAVLQSYFTAASFIFYLLEHRGSQADFFTIYRNIDLMYEIYGVDMQGMIYEWLEHLNYFK